MQLIFTLPYPDRYQPLHAILQGHGHGVYSLIFLPDDDEEEQRVADPDDVSVDQCHILLTMNGTYQ